MSSPADVISIKGVRGRKPKAKSALKIVKVAIDQEAITSAFDKAVRARALSVALCEIVELKLRGGSHGEFAIFDCMEECFEGIIDVIEDIQLAQEASQ
ncbi:MAG: hypothetical protein AAFY56_04335 [Pseudomonadota bacterium]